VHLTKDDIETLVYLRDKLSNDEVEVMSSHIQTCEVCHYLVGSEQRLYLELKRGYRVGTQPPLILTLAAKHYQKPTKSKKIVLAADAAVTAANGFENIGSFMSSEYGIVVRFVRDAATGRVHISALSANEQASLSYILLRQKHKQTVILLDQHARATVSADQFTGTQDGQPLEIEILFPVVEITHPVWDREEIQDDFKVRLVREAEEFSIHITKLKPYMPDLKRVYVSYKDGAVAQAMLRADQRFCVGQAVAWIRLYAG